MLSTNSQGKLHYGLELRLCSWTAVVHWVRFGTSNTILKKWLMGLFLWHMLDCSQSNVKSTQTTQGCYTCEQRHPMSSLFVSNGSFDGVSVCLLLSQRTFLTLEKKNLTAHHQSKCSFTDHGQHHILYVDAYVRQHGVSTIGIMSSFIR